MPLEAIQPGATALTRTGAHSSAAVSVKLSMPARAAPEWPMPGMPPHMSAMMLTIAPPSQLAAAVVVEHPLGDALARHQEAAGQVVAHDRVPALGADRRERRRELAAGVVDEAVDAAVAREHGRDGRPAPRLRRGCRRRASSRRRPPLRSRRAPPASFSALRPTIATRAPSDGQLVRGAAADARAAAGDERTWPANRRARRRSGRRHRGGRADDSTKQLAW